MSTLGTLSWVKRINASTVVSVTPTISAASFTAGLQLGGILTLPNVIRQDSNLGFGFSELVEVTILDSDKQNVAIDLWLFNQSPTVTSVNHGAFAMTSANLKLQSLGVVSAGVAYSSAAAVSVSSTTNLNKVLQVSGTVANPSNLYAIAVCQGTATYTTTTSLQFQFGFFLD